MEITCENCDYNNKAGPEVVAHCKKCKQRGRIGYWEPKSPAQVPDILTPENARDGMTIRKAYDISMPRTLRWCKELSAWVYCHRGQWCHLRDETMGEWKIVSEPPEPPIVSTDQNYPPELPIGHVDGPDSVLDVIPDVIRDVDGVITRLEDVQQNSPNNFVKPVREALELQYQIRGGLDPACNITYPKPDSRLKAVGDLIDESIDYFEGVRDAGSVNGLVCAMAGEAVVRLENMQSFIGDKASTRTVAPDSVLKALGERIDDNITRIEAFVDQSDGAEIPEFKRFIEAMHVEFDNMQRIIGDKANSRTVGTDSVLEGFRPLVDEAMDAMDAMSATVSLSKENGVLFDSVTGCLLMMENILGKASTPQVEPEPDGHWKCLKCGRLNAPSRSKCRYPECEAPRGSRGITEPEPAPDKLTGTDDPERSIWQIGDEICNRVRELQEKWRKINE